MGFEPTSDPGLALSIPRIGVAEVLRGWSGEGSIYEDLAAASSPDALDWTAGDIRRRARRVLLALVEPESSTWPETAEAWLEYLPASSVSTKQVTRTPAGGGISWAESMRRYQWPPRAFVGRGRSRVADEVAIGTLGWLAHELRRLAEDVMSLSPLAGTRLLDRVGAVTEALGEFHAEAFYRPDRLDLLALASSGYPWRSVATAANMLVRSERDPEFIAFELIAPDLEVGWRLFHLAVYGMVIRALRSHRFLITWRRPISGTRSGAQVEAIGPSGSQYDLWFEASAARGAYGLPPSSYKDAVGAIAGVGGSIGVDVMLIQPHVRALLLECKWSTDVTYVGRDGFHQAASYALDAIGGLAPTVWSFVVGPHEVVPMTSVALGLRDQLGVVMGSTSPIRIGDVVSAFLADDPLAAT